MKSNHKDAKKSVVKSVKNLKLTKEPALAKQHKPTKTAKPVKTAKPTQSAKAAKAEKVVKPTKLKTITKNSVLSVIDVITDDPSMRMKRKIYEAELRKLHEELVALQLWVVHKKLKVMVVFEGRDGAGKGGVIKAMTERVSPRVFRVVALPAPNEREKSQIYMQRYIKHFPAAGEVVIFDRSWYNRAGVERVLGFCTKEQTEHFLETVPLFEKAMVDSDIILIKYWLEISQEEQTKRLKERIHDGRKIWKLSSLDLKSYNRWYDYSRARDAMFKASDNGYAPWYLGNNNDARRGRLNVISHFLSQIPYEKMKREKIKLPKRQKPNGYVEIEQNFKTIEEKY